MKSYKKPQYRRTTLLVNETVEGETIEQKIERIVSNKEPIKDGAPIIYTERKDGIGSAYNIRTDRWEVASDAMDIVARNDIAKRMGKPEGTKVIDLNAGGEPTGGTNENQ